MKYTEARILAARSHVDACLARIEGMKAVNIARERHNQALAYEEEAFFSIAEDMLNYANEIRELADRGDCE